MRTFDRVRCVQVSVSAVLLSKLIVSVSKFISTEFFWHMETLEWFWIVVIFQHSAISSITTFKFNSNMSIMSTFNFYIIPSSLLTISFIYLYEMSHGPSGGNSYTLFFVLTCSRSTIINY